MLLLGIGFALCFATLNIEATTAVGDREHGLASGLVQTSFQVGGAVGLAVVSAIVTSRAGGSTDHSVLLNAYQTALVVVTGVAIAGPAVAVGGRALPKGATACACPSAGPTRRLPTTSAPGRDWRGDPWRRARTAGRQGRPAARAMFRPSTGATCGNAEGGAMPPTPTRLSTRPTPGMDIVYSRHTSPRARAQSDAGDQHPAANHRASAPPLPTYPGAGGRSAKRVDRHHRPAGQSEQARDRPSWWPSSLQAR